MRPSVRLALLLLLTTRSPAHALDIIACGQEVPSGATGTLAADLTCPPSGYGVLLGSKSTLQLNGHSITGATISVYVPGGRKVVIEGPGESPARSRSESSRPTASAGLA